MGQGVIRVEIVKLDRKTLTQAQFDQIVAIEENCGLEPYTPEMLLDCIENLDTYACMDGDNVAGFITVHPSSRKPGDGIYIVNLNVAKAYRRRGLAQRLMITACAHYANSHRGRFVTLDVAKNNTAALSLYKKLGFAITDIPSRNGNADVVMVEKLDRLVRQNEEQV